MKATLKKEIFSNKMRIFNRKNYEERLLNFIDNLKLDLPSFKTVKEVYDYIFNEKDKYCVCGNENEFKRFTEGYTKFCSKKCLHEWRSNNMKGDNNVYHKLSESDKINIRSKNSITMKEKIRKGEFTPAITNSWGNTRIQLLIDEKIKKYRSSWDAAFQLLNPDLKYEKIRIPYINEKGKSTNYIVDFNSDNIIYEIKPSSKKTDIRNRLKEKAAIEWCKNNNYEFIYISEEYFEDNLNKDILLGHPDSDKLLKNLKQFYENKVN